MKKTFLASTALICALASPGFAREFGERLTITGTATISAADISGVNTTYGIGDLNGLYSFGAVGVDFSVVAYADEDDQASVLYGGLSYTFGNGGRVVAGAPRSAYDFYATAAIGDSIAQHVFSQATSSLSPLTYLQLQDNYNIYGLRYDSGKGSAFTYSGSIHQLASENVTFIALGASYDISGVKVSGGIESWLEGSSTYSTFAKLKVQKDFGKFGGALFIGNRSASGTNYTYSELSGTYRPNDRLVFGGLIAGFSNNSDLIYGLNAGYEVVPGGVLRLGALMTKDNDPDFELGFKYSF